MSENNEHEHEHKAESPSSPASPASPVSPSRPDDHEHRIAHVEREVTGVRESVDGLHELITERLPEKATEVAEGDPSGVQHEHEHDDGPHDRGPWLHRKW